MILATVNQFRLGGTETYLASAARAMSRRGLECGLATSQLVPGAPHLDAFARVSLTGDGTRTRILEQWMASLDEVLARREVRAVWSHHYDLLPVWAASRLHGLPLVTTFHGPLTGAGRPNPPFQALGMTLAIHRGEAVTCVSEEAAEAIRGLRPGHPRLRVIPNRVELDARAGETSPTRLPPRRFLLVARPQKLEHLRSAVAVFREYARWRRGCTLSILAAEESTEPAEPARGLLARLRERGRICRARLGARWCMKRPLSFLRLLPQLRFREPTESVARLLSETDFVFGMGRVILEGLAAGRPALLIGYDSPHGIVTPSRLDAFARSNFSGRGCERLSIAESVREIRELELTDWRLPPELLGRFDVERTVDELEQLVSSIGADSVPGEADTALARRIASLGREGAPDDVVVEEVIRSLTPTERETFAELVEG